MNGSTRTSSQAGGEGDGGALEPDVAVDEGGHGERAGLGGAGDHAVPLPLDPGRGVRAGPRVHVLAVVERVESEVAIPLEPPGRVDQRVELRLHEHGARVLLPRAAEVGLRVARGEVRRGGHLAALDRDARVLVGVLAALRREDVLLVGQRLARVQVAALQHDGGVAEDEVDGAVHVAVAEELAQGVHVQRVLVPHEAAPVERRQVRAHAQRHRLVLGRAGAVLDRQVACQKVAAHHS
jgi:hypothetical protein